MDWDYIANKFSESPDQILFHYTDIRGLEGIINNKEIWATDHCQLNDYSEFDHGIQVFRNVVADEDIKKNKLLQGRYDHYDDLVSVLKGMTRTEGTFCCSFTPEGNLLSQWRGYCPKEGGYSIGFSKDELIKITAKHYTNFFRCVYEERDQSEIARQVIEELFYMFESPAGLSGCGNQTFHTHLRSAVSFFASAFKNQHFLAENEWRLVSRNTNKSELCYRAKGNVLDVVPYITLPMLNTAIERIYIGPCGDSESAKMALEKFVRSKGINPEIIISDIPLR
jgi:DUF2971 family protein